MFGRLLKNNNVKRMRKYLKGIVLTCITAFSCLITSAQAPQQDKVKGADWQKNILPPNAAPQAAGQPCDNVDFEYGTLINWDCYVGTNNYNCNVGIGNVNAAVNGRHTIMTGAGFDPQVGNNLLRIVDPQGGGYSCRLGNASAGAEAERIEQTFRVTNATSSFTYRYAVVLSQVLNWYSCNEPFFKIEMLDVNGVPISCADNLIAVGLGIPGFQSYAAGFWKDWTTVNIDLTAYIGQDVTIRYTTADEAYSGRYGYAYIDGTCAGYNIQTSDTLCSGECITLTAPYGAQSYLWSGPGAAQGATTQSIVTCLPGLYSVQTNIISVCGNQNPNSIQYYNVALYPDPVAAISSNAICNLTVDFADASTIPNNFNNTTITQWAWDFENDGTIDDTTQNPFHTYPAAGTYTTLLAVTTANGCRDTISTQVQAFALNDPIVSFTSINLCNGSPMQFTDQSTTTAGVINKWAWDFDFDGIIDSRIQYPSHSFPSYGTFPVVLTVKNSYGCVGTDTINVIVHPEPIANFATADVCYGSTTQFTDQSTINGVGNTITTWSWDFGDGAPIDNSPNPSHTYVSPGTYVVVLTVITNNGCSSTIQKNTVVYPNPTADFSFNTVCLGQATSFSDLSVVIGNGNNNYALNWDFGDGTNAIIQNPSHTYLNPGTYNVTLVITTNKGCIDSITKQIVVHPNPAAAFIQTNVCLGTVMQFTDASTITNGNTITGWSWDFDNNGSIDDNTQNPSYNYLAVGTYTVKFTVTSNNGCTKTITQQVKVFPNPAAQFTQADVCIGAAMPFTDQSTIPNGNTITAWAWDFENDGSIDANTQNPTYNYVAAGTYTVALTVTSNNGCPRTITQQVTVHPLPIVTLNLNVDTLCLDILAVTLTGGLPAGGTYTGPGIQNGQFYVQLSGVGTHQIIYTYSDANGCVNADSALLVVDACTGINEKGNTHTMRVYPNPANDYFTIETLLNKNEKVQIEVLDILGKIVFTSEENAKVGLFKKQINSGKFANGIYVVSVKTTEGISVQRIVKE